jgi:3-oxoacyl-[acyl-carrier protein] reductase
VRPAEKTVEKESDVELRDLKVLVTGGGSGLGREFTLSLARAGAGVAFCDVVEAPLRETESLAKGLPGKVVGFVASVADEAQVTQLVSDAHAALGGLNGLVNNAGIFRDALLVKQDRKTGAIQKMSLDHWNAVIGVDLTGPFLCAREFAAKVIETKGAPAVIVNISSASRHGTRGQSNYSAAKAGLIADTKLWAEELAPHGIRTGAVAPGFIDTPILRGMKPEVLEAMLAAVPLRRPGQASEIFQAVKFIFECDYFTGRCIDVDGGIRT